MSIMIYEDVIKHYLYMYIFFGELIVSPFVLNLNIELVKRIDAINHNTVVTSFSCLFFLHLSFCCLIPTCI